MEGTVQHAGDPAFGAQFAAALAWWRDAGVDCDFVDEPVRWLKPEDDGSGRAGDAPPPPALIMEAAEAAPPPPQLADLKAHWPARLDEFAGWWLSEPLLDNGQVRGRIAPRGEAGADLMIVVPQPEAMDEDGLLSGPEGALVAAFLRAAGIAPERVYLASALPRHTPLADWPALARAGIGEVLRHHVGLVAPKRLLVLGSGILPLLGNNLPQNAQFLGTFNHEVGNIPLLAHYEPGAMLGRAARKQGLWQRWLEFSSTDISGRGVAD